MASKIYNYADSYLSRVNSLAHTLGLGVYDGLLSKQYGSSSKVTMQQTSDTLTEKTPVVHTESVGDDYGDTIGVYYVNYPNIYNTLNRNIGGSTYMSQNYDIMDEGDNLGQRAPVLFSQSERETPLFLSDSERDSYTNYLTYISDKFGTPTYYDSTILEEPKTGYTVGSKNGFYIGESVNPNELSTDSLLGKLSSASLGNIVDSKNTRKKLKDFTSITNISYYDKGRTDIEESDGLEAMNTAVGFSYSKKQPNFGILEDYAFTGFSAPTEDYTYASITQRYTLFDKYGDVRNNIISLTDSPAYNSIRKPDVKSNDTVEMAQFLLENLSYKGIMSGSDSFYTYFGRHGFDVSFEDVDAKDRYAISVSTMPSGGNGVHSDFHYDEGYLQGSGYSNANPGTNHGIYMTANALYGAYGKDLSSVTNKAFLNDKYDTIIARFATQNKGRGGGGTKSKQEDGLEQFQTAVSRQFGMSHGRNLLKVKKSGNDITGVDTSGGNGYDNPYCRVWTYHHQYNRICDTIRPFSTANADGSCTTDDFTGAEEIGKYRNSFVEVEKVNGLYSEGTANRNFKVIESDGQNLLHNESVRNKINGLVNITPTNKNVDGQADAVDVKHCMFSIENLAWKDVNQNIDNISGEQVGPLGGRIMWFPPYGLTFSENVSCPWNSVSFIGRGENIYTYANTERSGNLSFILLIDHPSLLNEWNRKASVGEDGVDDIQSPEQKILRFFAGCEKLTPFSGTKPLSGDSKTEKQPDPQKEPEKEPAKGQFSFIVYYPNNYSGRYDTPEQAISYLLNGIMYGEATLGKQSVSTAFKYDSVEATSGLLKTLSELEVGNYAITITNASGGTSAYNQKLYQGRKDTVAANLPSGVTATYKFGGVDQHASEAVVNISPKDGSSNMFDLKYDILNYQYVRDGQNFMGGYEMHATSATTSYGVSTPHFNTNEYNPKVTTLRQVKSGQKTYDYIHYIGIGVNDGTKTTNMNFYCPYNHTVYKTSKKKVDYRHSWGYRIDCCDDNVFQQSLIATTTDTKLTFDNADTIYDNYLDSRSYGLNALGYDNPTAQSYFKSIWELGPVYSLTDVAAALMPDYKDSLALKGNFSEDHVKDIQKFINYGIAKIEVNGSASVQGNYKGSAVNTDQGQTVDTANDTLSTNRGKTIATWFGKLIKQQNVQVEKKTIPLHIEPRGESKMGGSVDTIDMKAQRFAAVTIYYDESISLNARENSTKYTTSGGTSDYISGGTSGNTSGDTVPTSTRSGNVDADNQVVHDLDEVSSTNAGRYQNIRYDNESLFFQTLKTNDPFLHSKIMDKVKYFDPAFHSVTPEGFAARLTFLQQCTRQGNTIGASDSKKLTATNLAFGRPPICVLRIGDFYYTKIVIDSLNISYENGNGIQWDMNPEGIGIIPMYAKIDINFKFIGGSDLKGPVSRLQNALSFNYYANTRVYDNRSDGVDYTEDNSGTIEKITPWTPMMD